MNVLRRYFLHALEDADRHPHVKLYAPETRILVAEVLAGVQRMAEVYMASTAASRRANRALSCALMLGSTSLAGCASLFGDGQSARINDRFEVYAPFDNERDSGPGYLTDSPYHQNGDENPMGAVRYPPQLYPTDPKNAPLTSTPLQPLSPLP